MGSLHNQKWKDPLSSVGDYRGMTEIKTAKMFKGKRCCWEAKDGSPASNALKQLVPKINELFRTSGNRVPDSAMVLMDIFMMGETAEESVPYIMFSCPNICKRARIEAMNLVRRSGLLKEFPGLKVFHWEFPPHIPNPELTIADPGGSNTTSLEEVWSGSRDESAPEVFLVATSNGKVDICTSRRSTIGAIIRFGKCVLYFTAAHMLLLENNTANREQPQEDDLDDISECGSDYLSGDDSAHGPKDDVESIGSSRMVQHTPSPSEQASDTGENISSRRIPSLDSETRVFDIPSQCNENSATLSFLENPHFTNGEVFFKSHELDFALLDLSDLEMPPCNIPELNVTTISDIRAGSTDVVAHAGSRRNLHGQMSGRPSYIRFPHGGIYQEVYPILFTEDVQVGDSGSIVRDADTGKIYGHIVVASVASRTAFIVPATKVLRAISWLTQVASSIYTSIDHESGQFRLVRLLPSSSSGDGICCELFVAGLNERLEYDALSYVWGEQEETKPILLNGQPWNVRPVLAAALRRLRDEVREKHIWIDTLCIDQTNSHERQRQSRHTKEVLGKSERCLIWLGDVYNEPSSLAFSLTHPPIHQPSKASSGTALSYQDANLAFGFIAAFEGLHKQHQAASIERARRLLTSEHQQALGNLMALSWWKRFWPFQDAISTRSASLICGKLDMTLDFVGIAASMMRKYLQHDAWRREEYALDFDVLLPFLRTVGRLQHFQKSRVPKNFTFVMNSFRDLDCWDPRDKAFALLSRFHDVKITYSLDYSHPIDRIYEAATVRQLRSTKTLFPLARTTEYGRHPLLPSWVPDWSASINSTPEFHSELSFLMCWDIFDASCGKKSRISIRDHTLNVRGLLIDRVSTTYGLMKPGIDLPALIFKVAFEFGDESTSQSSQWSETWIEKWIEKWAKSQQMSSSLFQGQTHGSLGRDFWRLFTSDIRMSRDVMEWRRALDSDLEVCLREFQNGLLGHGVRGRRLFSTETRYIGLGPAEMEVGDVVVVLYGGRFPFVLRPTVDQKYSLVGYAYVLGIMDGEAVSGSQETQTFKIV